MRKRRAITGYLFILPFLIGFFFFVAGPLVTSLRMSFSKVSLDSTAGFTMQSVGLENYLRALTVDKDFNRLLWDSVRSLLIDVPSIILFSLIIAVLLNRKFPGRSAIRAIFFMPVILASGVVLGMEKSNILLTGVQELQKTASDTTITTALQKLLLGAMGQNAFVDVILTIMTICTRSSSPPASRRSSSSLRCKPSTPRSMRRRRWRDAANGNACGRSQFRWSAP